MALLFTVGVTLFWAGEAQSTSDQTCNYFQNDNYASGYAQPIDRCIADYSNQWSFLYTCSASGDMVTAQRFETSSECDATSSNVTTKVYSASNASFECNGDDSCDICYRTYGGCDIDGADVALYESCFIDGVCNSLYGTVETKDGSTPTSYSAIVTCRSKTRWRSTDYTGSSDCSNSGSITNNDAGCATNTIGGDVYFEIYANPCTNDRACGLAMNTFILCFSLFVSSFFV